MPFLVESLKKKYIYIYIKKLKLFPSNNYILFVLKRNLIGFNIRKINYLFEIYLPVLKFKIISIKYVSVNVII